MYVLLFFCVVFFFWGGGGGGGWGAEETRLNHWKSAVSASLCSPIPTDRARGVASLCLALPGAKPQASVYHILPPRKCAGKRGLASALGANSKHWFTTSVLQRCRKARLGMCMRSCVHLGCAPQRLVQFKPKDSSPRLVPRQHFPASSALNQSVSPVGSSEVVKFYTLYNCTFVSESWRRECWGEGGWRRRKPETSVCMVNSNDERGRRKQRQNFMVYQDSLSEGGSGVGAGARTRGPFIALGGGEGGGEEQELA